MKQRWYNVGISVRRDPAWNEKKTSLRLTGRQINVISPHSAAAYAAAGGYTGKLIRLKICDLFLKSAEQADRGIRHSKSKSDRDLRLCKEDF